MIDVAAGLTLAIATLGACSYAFVAAWRAMLG